MSLITYNQQIIKDLIIHGGGGSGDGGGDGGDILDPSFPELDAEGNAKVIVPVAGKFLGAFAAEPTVYTNVSDYYLNTTNHNLYQFRYDNDNNYPPKWFPIIKDLSDPIWQGKDWCGYYGATDEFTVNNTLFQVYYNTTDMTFYERDAGESDWDAVSENTGTYNKQVILSGEEQSTTHYAKANHTHILDAKSFFSDLFPEVVDPIELKEMTGSSGPEDGVIKRKMSVKALDVIYHPVGQINPSTDGALVKNEAVRRLKALGLNFHDFANTANPHSYDLIPNTVEQGQTQFGPTLKYMHSGNIVCIYSAGFTASADIGATVALGELNGSILPSTSYKTLELFPPLMVYIGRKTLAGFITLGYSTNKWVLTYNGTTISTGAAVNIGSALYYMEE
jgi:hypothetical protein